MHGGLPKQNAKHPAQRFRGTPQQLIADSEGAQVLRPHRKLAQPAHITVFHNGVLIQNNVEPTGPTGWVNRAPYTPHPEKQPIAFQDHGNPVRFRNIWIREVKGYDSGAAGTAPAADATR